jgi:REP element-mobilizing transposase RayT
MKNIKSNKRIILQRFERILLETSIMGTWYFIATAWEISHKTIKNYVYHQWKEEHEATELEL